LFDHPPYSPAVAPSDYYLFTYLKTWLASQRFNNNEQLMKCVKTWLNSQAADFFDTGRQKYSASFPAVTRLRSRLSMCVFFVCNKCFLIVSLLTARRMLISE
jgi:hypothetical protein